MAAKGSNPFVPRSRNLMKLRSAAAHCEACDLWRRATQTVFGEGPVDARLMLVGETPGDQEDLQGHPFVGPSGTLLDESLAAAGIDRGQCYVTNVVKHFKWTPRGKKRLHGKPTSREILACRPWLNAEIESLDPKLIVCLGATAAQTMLGRDFRITRSRGTILPAQDGSRFILATYHPSAVLRAPSQGDRQRMRRELVEDLHVAARWLARHRQA
jgi:uracil-DNA glycosylase family protein